MTFLAIYFGTIAAFMVAIVTVTVYGILKENQK